jgi:transcriptional regulator with XRE-family HTH domain
MSDVRVQFGKGIRQRRVEIGFSQERLAERAGIHRTYLADVERGERNVSLENIVKIISALNLSLSDFFEKYFEINYENNF